MMPPGIRQAKLVDSASQNIRPYRICRILFSIWYWVESTEKQEDKKTRTKEYYFVKLAYLKVNLLILLVDFKRCLPLK